MHILLRTTGRISPLPMQIVTELILVAYSLCRTISTLLINFLENFFLEKANDCFFKKNSS